MDHGRQRPDEYVLTTLTGNAFAHNKPATDDHGNKNNVVVVKNNLNVIIQSPPAVPPSKAAEKEIDRPSTEKAQTTAMQERSPTQSTQDVSKQADNPSNTKGFEGNTKSQSSLSPSIPPSDLVSIDATSTKQTANTAAEVADSAAKLDQTPPKTSLDTSAPHEDAAKKEAASGAADQAVATTIAAKAVNQSTAEVKSPQVNLADTIVSPHVPPAPAATPVAISPSLLATKATSPDSVPPLPSPDEPLKGLDPAASAIDAKLGPSEQEIDVAAPRLPPSSVAPPTQRDSKLKPSKQELAVAAPVSSEISNTTLQRFGLQGREPAASFAPQVPLPPSPKPSTRASSVEASEAPQTGEFPEDDPKLVKRQTTFRERGTAVVQTLMTIPNMVAAFFLGIMSAFTDWLDTTFNPQRRTRGSEDGKTAKQD